MSFAPIGTVTVGPQDREVLVGSFTMEEGDDAIFFRITQTSPQEKWNYSYGLVTFRTALGQEIGTSKIYGSIYSENFRLGIGLSPVERTGSVYFTPRAYNQQWIRIATPPLWTLEFEAQSGSTSGGGGGSGLDGAFGGILSDVAGAVLTYTFKEGFAYILVS